ncbi:MAG: hypothetical protein KAZ20_00345 [Sediminibacterium sp.]|nr:hypothetical protein [Sediminibacterium sp.]
MKNIFLLLSLLLSKQMIAQNQRSIAFQAVARNSQGIVISNKQLQVRISLLTDTIKNNIVYQEIKSITTNPLGLFTILIGANEFAKIKTEGDFTKIKWSEKEHFIRVEIDPDNHLNFTYVGQQPINYVAYAFTADHIKSTGIEGVIQIEQGGTGVTNLLDIKQALQLDKVNNTPDSSKALSKAASLAISNKLDKKDTASLSNRINQKLNKGEINKAELEASLGFLPFQTDYGVFFDTSRQIATINTATAVKWRDTSSNSRLYISNNTSMEPSRISVVKEGVYFLHYNLQASNGQIANDEISVWIRRNGAAYPNSLRQFLTGAIGAKNIFSGQAIIPIGEADYVELFFSVRNGQTQLLKTNNLSNPSRPSTPSAQILLYRIQ